MCAKPLHPVIEPSAVAVGPEAAERRGTPARRPPTTVFAAIDVGTNSIHQVIAEISPEGDFKILDSDKDMVMLGQGGFINQQLTSAAMDLGLAALKRYQRIAELKGAAKIKAVATSAVREAHNGGSFVERVRRETGLQLLVISREEEGRLIYLGVRHAVELGNHDNLIVDIGGGSAELIVGNAEQALAIHSLKIGGSRLAELFLRRDPPHPDELKALRHHVRDQLAPVLATLQARTFARCIGTAGTTKHLAGLCAAYGGRGAEGESSGVFIHADELHGLVPELLAKSRAQRLAMRGMDPRRVNGCVAAGVVLLAVFDGLGLRTLEYCESALREGMIVDYIGRHRQKLRARATWPDPRSRSVLYLAERCGYRRAHAEQVARLALRLFDELAPLHGLPASYRELLHYAGLLHDIGYLIGHTAHHKHSYYLISNGELKGFDPQEIEVIANIARYHRKERPKTAHFSYQRLIRAHRRPVRCLAVLLRLADALERTHYGVVQDVYCRIGRRTVDLRVRAVQDAELELWTAQHNCAYFEREYGRRLRVRLAEESAPEAPRGQ